LNVGFSVRDFFSTPLKLNLFRIKLERRNVSSSGISEEMDRIIHFTAQIADYLVEKHHAQPIFIPHHYLEKKDQVILTDAEIAERIIGRMKNKAEACVVENNLHPYTLLSLYRRLDMVLSMRHHANSFAYRYGIPCIGYAISEKMINFFKHIGREDMLVDPYAENLNDAISLIDRSIRERKRISTELRRGLESQQRDMDRALDTVLTDP
jgi:polysaccharide pyruvyl transferase WcaK-like protein